jgi:1-acyl-sn-glycerol-3-phosphate acyltransferase
VTGEGPLRRWLLDLRAVLLWIASALHFFPVGAFLVVLGAFVDPRRNDRPQRVFFRNALRLAGASLRVERADGFDPTRTSFFVCNHVNVFDPFVIYSAIPQFVRGLHLESHFRVPVYGWMMERFGNIGVPVERTPAAVRIMRRRCRGALDDGISLIVFPEGHRTRTGRVGPFRLGVFRMAREFGIPIVPMSIVGAFRLKRAKRWRLRPASITVRLHDTIDPSEWIDLGDRELMERVREIVRRPVEEALDAESLEGR